ncbi:FecR family protein [Mucilaginibacter sp. UR6-11]|uniref:FecR family protein n=1 Tax=Mucilaginibacter sp. UR6-11 TaxID=1435644 RepID=UPI001E5ABB37|nr:FecR family protein [Mucilaginibacter sp. UR6-11]MCC8423589.1 DUF4974 domain-containing protein [Mucilaginibacter sp. UR6-11]
MSYPKKRITMEDEQYYRLLVQRFTDRTATDEELEVFIKLANEGKLDAYLTEAMNREAGITEQDEANFPAPVKTVRLWPRYVAAASILLFLSFGAYFLLKPKPTPQLAQNTILPGTNKAILTLGNGQKIDLNDAKNGALVKAAGIRITKDKKGQITYVVENTGQPAQYNTTTTPKGGQWHLVLADGTQVWLNAASSLHYPTAFNGKERLVELTGEGYFEVAKDKAHPFIVKTAQESVQVLGTHFNINSYADEPSVKTTLLEGSVKVSNAQRSVLIKPGEQAVLVNNDLVVKEADTEEAVAWKEGRFIFNDESLESIMRKVSRWYDVDITYKGVDPKQVFGGTLSRYGELNKLLHKIELTQGVHFKVEGRRIVVTP